jgi:hypothetical protein
MAEKNFMEDLDLELDNIEPSSSQPDSRKPRSLKEHHRAAKKAERGPLRNQTYTIPESVIEDLRQHVLARKMAGEKISASQVVVDGIKMYLKKHI